MERKQHVRRKEGVGHWKHGENQTVQQRIDPQNKSFTIDDQISDFQTT